MLNGNEISSRATRDGVALFMSSRLALHHAALVQRIANQWDVPRNGRVTAWCYRVVNAGFKPTAVSVT